MIKNKKKLFIIGSGGLALEVYELIQQEKLNFDIQGFLSNDKINKEVIDKKKILGNNNYLKKNFSKNSQNIYLVIAIGDPKIRYKIYNDLNKLKFCWPNLYPSSLKWRYSSIGIGNIIFDSVSISPNVNISDFNLIHKNSFIAHDSQINNFCNINPNVCINGEVLVDDFCQIGSSATIIPRVKLLKNSKIGLGSVIINNTKKNKTYFGNPGRIVSK